MKRIPGAYIILKEPGTAWHKGSEISLQLVEKNNIAYPCASARHYVHRIANA